MSEFLAEASVKIIPDTTGFRQQLVAQLSSEIALAEKQLATSTAASTGPIAQRATVQTKAAQAATKDTSALKANTKAAAQAARSHEQLARGAGSSLLTLLGIRGATLAASGAFLAGAAAIGILQKSVSGAIDDEETLFRVTRILGEELGEGSRRWSQTLADSFGIADDAALKFEGAIAESLHNVGIAPRENARLSQSFVELAADMAAFSHVPVEDTLRALSLGISGNQRALRQYGVVVQNAEVQQRALNETGKDSVAQLTRQELALARIAIIQERTANQVGAFADNAGSLANQAKILSANLDALGDSIGSALLPPLTALTEKAVDAAKALKFVVDQAKNLAPAAQDAGGKATFFGQALHVVGEGAKFAALGSVSGAAAVAALTFELLKGDAAAKRAGVSFELTAGNLQRAGVMTNIVKNYLDSLSTSFDRAAAKFRQGLHLQITVTTRNLTAAGINLLRLQAEGASLPSQLSAAQAQLRAAEAAVSAADEARSSNLPGAPTAQKKALQQELQARQEVASIQGQIDAENTKATKATAKATKSAQEIADEQDQQLLAEQGLAQGRIEILQAKADHTKSLVDDLAATKAQVALLSQQIVEAQKIHDRVTRLQTIQQLTLARERALDEITETEAEIARNRRDRRVKKAESAVESAQLDFEFAQTTGNKSAQVTALEQENEELEKQKALWQGNTLKLKEIRNRIAANNAEIRKIRGTVGERTNELARLQFQFLETQAGFAANLLGNLIPRSAAVGTVGGAGVPAISTSTGPGPAGFATAAHRRPFNDLSAASQTSATAGGASRGQMATLIQINQGMLGALLRIAGRQARPHPEIAYQAQTSGIDFNVATGT